MSTEEINIEIAARVAKLQQTLESIPGLGAKAAKKLTNDVAKEWRDLEKRTKSSQDKIAKEWEKKLGDIKRGSEKVFGGIIGDIQDVAQGFGAVAGTAGTTAAALGVVGLAAAGVAIGAVKGAQALFSIIEGADASIAALREMQGIEPLPQESIDKIDAWKVGALAAEEAGHRLSVVLAGELAESFEDLPFLLAAVTESLVGVVGVIGQMKDAAETAAPVARVLAAVMSLGATEVVGLTGAIDGAVEAQREQAAVQKEATSNATDEKMAQAMLAEIEREERIARDQATEAKRRAAEASRAAAEAMREELDAAAEVNDFLRLEAKRRAEIAEGNAAFESKLDAERAAETERFLVAAFDRELGYLDELAAVKAERTEEQLAADEDAARALADQRIASINQIGDAYMALTGLMAQGDEDMSERQKRLALAAFRANQGGAVSMIAVNAAVAIMRALADLGPIAGPIAAGAIGVTAATQTATVLSQKPPEFPMGGVARRQLSADHFMIGVQDEEGIVNHRGMRDLGEDGLNRLNAGMGLGGGTLVVEQRYRHRVFDRFVRDNLRRGGPLSRALTGRRKPGHSNRG